MVSRTKVQMGTYITISVDTKNKAYLEDAFKIISEVEHSLSSYDSQGLIYILNKEKQVTLNSYAYEALLLSKMYYQQTSGYFNIAIGSITKGLYKFGMNEQIPDKKELKKANVLLDGLKYNEKSASIEKDMQIDLGGMGKGFGVDKVARYFADNNITNAIIAASGDIRCLSECQIDVQNPLSETFLASFTTSKKNLGISTSGNYNRYIDSVENNHLINPKSKMSQRDFISITLISEIPSSALDAYTTAVSVMPPIQAYRFLKDRNIAYIILENDLSLKVSDNIGKYTKELFVYDTVKDKPDSIKNE